MKEVKNNDEYDDGDNKNYEVGGNKLKHFDKNFSVNCSLYLNAAITRTKAFSV